MADIISEPGIDFCGDNAFHIEESKSYKDMRGKGVNSVEFVREKDGDLLFVEAKSTFPNPDNPSPENLLRFRSAIDEVCDKFIHSLNLFSSIAVGVANGYFPETFLMPEKVKLVFLLVISTHEAKWCMKPKKAIMRALPAYLKQIWKPEVYVMNKETAVKYGIAVRH